MIATPPSEHRRASRRFETALFVRFSVNGGPEHVSNTLNFTSKSLAIRSSCGAQKGDHVIVRFGSLPPIAGEVARVFPEGFAVALNEASLELVTYAGNNQQAELADDFSVLASETAISSPFLRASADKPARIRVSTINNPDRPQKQHFLLIVSADPAIFIDVGSIWLKSSETRWSARALGLTRRGDRGLALIALNDWQLHMAAAYGLTIYVVSSNLETWSFAVDAAPVADHLFALEPAAFAISA